MKIVIATFNRGKVREIEQVCSALPFEFLSLSSFSNPPRVVEDGKTYRENATKKATAIARFTGLWTLADDSGIEVDALNGKPGVLSARYAGEDATDADNNKKLLDELANVPQQKRTARYRASIVLASPQKVEAEADGVCEGVIGSEPRGANGFGYDPLFIVPEYNKTMAELPPEIKNRISHRARALENIKIFLKLLK